MVAQETEIAAKYVWGVWGSGPQTDRHLTQSPFTGQFFLDDDILHCLLRVLSFLYMEKLTTCWEALSIVDGLLTLGALLGLQGLRHLHTLKQARSGLQGSAVLLVLRQNVA